MSRPEIRDLANQIIRSVESVSEHSDTNLDRLFVIGYLAGHLATILHDDPILRREFFAKISHKKSKGPAAKG